MNYIFQEADAAAAGAPAAGAPAAGAPAAAAPAAGKYHSKYTKQDLKIFHLNNMYIFINLPYFQLLWQTYLMLSYFLCLCNYKPYMKELFLISTFKAHCS